MKKSSLFLILICFSFLISCEKELEYDKDLMSPKLVVQGILEIDSTFAIYLERTYAFNESNPETEITSGAVITVVNLNSGASFTSSVPVDSNRYEFPFNTAANTDYEITVTHPDYPTVTATTHTTNVVPLISVDTLALMNDSYPKLIGTMKWQDPPGQNYYMVRVNFMYYDEDSISIGGGGSAYSYDPVIDNSSNSDPLSPESWDMYFVFTDEQFENSLKSLDIISNHPFNNWNPDFSKMEYHLTSLNYDTYLYYKTKLIQWHADPAFSEPSKVYSNVHNGYGVFGSVSGSIIDF
jgi:hypothetical protein